VPAPGDDLVVVVVGEALPGAEPDVTPVTVPDRPPSTPDESTAVTAYAYDVPAARPLSVYVVPLGEPTSDPSRYT
jgi:hypothetical protein